MYKPYLTLGLLIVGVILSGCHATAPENQRYLAAMQQGIARHFTDAQRYQGKVCRVTLKYAANQRYQVLRTEGDELLCLKTWSLVASAPDLPAPPPQLADGVAIDFRP